MKKNNSIGIILGIIFLVIGAGYLAEVFGVIDGFTIFFDGWWTLFIIVPCFLGLFKENGAKLSNLIGVAIGLFLLLMAQGVLDGEKLWALLIAAVCVLIGVNLMFPNKGKNSGDAQGQTDRFDRGYEEVCESATKTEAEHFADAEIVSEGVFIEEQKQGADSGAQHRESAQHHESAGGVDKVVCSAVFAGRDIRVENSYFDGADLSAIFGGIDLNLKNALIRKNVTIQVQALFGGIDILMPSDVRVVVDVTPILGSVDNGTRTPLGADENTPTVFIKGTCLFGGVEVK